jgi:hypothetical protein
MKQTWTVVHPQAGEYSFDDPYLDAFEHEYYVCTYYLSVFRERLVVRTGTTNESLPREQEQCHG